MTLNISFSATKDLSFNKNDISFKARFNVAKEHISIAYNEITAIFSEEVGDGFFFEVQSNDDDIKENLNKTPHLLSNQLNCCSIFIKKLL